MGRIEETIDRNPTLYSSWYYGIVRSQQKLTSWTQVQSDMNSIGWGNVCWMNGLQKCFEPSAHVINREWEHGGIPIWHRCASGSTRYGLLYIFFSNRIGATLKESNGWASMTATVNWVTQSPTHPALFTHQTRGRNWEEEKFGSIPKLNRCCCESSKQIVEVKTGYGPNACGTHIMRASEL